MQKHIEMPILILKEDCKNRNETRLPIDNFVSKTRKGDEKNKNEIQQPIDEFNPERREEQERDTAAHRMYREDPVAREDERQQDVLQHREARSDPQY